MNAIDFLIEEHDVVRNILKDIDYGPHDFKTKKDKFNKLSEMILLHEKIEEEVWYPQFRFSDKIDGTVKHLIKEEKHAEKAIERIKKINTEKEWLQNFKKFKDEVEKHAAEEETKLFPIVTQLLSTAQLNKIGNKMHQYKMECSTLLVN